LCEPCRESGIGKDDYAQSQFVVNPSIQTANPGVENTFVGWSVVNAAVDTNPEAGSGANTMRLNAGTGIMETATRLSPGKTKVLIAARFKGSVAAPLGGRFKTYYRHTQVPAAIPGSCEALYGGFYSQTNPNQIPGSGLPAFTLLFSQDFDLSPAWTSLPVYTGITSTIPAPPGGGVWATDFKIRAENKTSTANMWVDNFWGVGI
jgi:hypothetical protein